MKPLILITWLLITPLTTSAAVIINEIAWMGSATSPNHEWIELYNSGPDVDVTGWTIHDGNNLTITLAGIIPSLRYAVLERTSDDSASGSAFLIYTGALTNTGATLTLRDASNAIADQVAGGEGWANIGGDNATKQTAQYTGSRWVTGVATPGAVNVSTPSPPPSTPPATNPPPPGPTGNRLATPSRFTDPQPLVLPGVTLQIGVVAPSVGYVRQPISFTAVPSNVGTTIASSLTYEWNLGDGSYATSSGKDTTHTFLYPGRYIVNVYGSFARQYAEGRHEITILPVAFSLTRNTGGDVQISNDAPYEIDMSGYEVRAQKSVMLPPRTYLLPQSTLTIPRTRLGLTHAVHLHDATGALVASSDSFAVTTAVNDAPALLQQTTLSRVTPSPAVNESPRFGFAPQTEPIEPDPLELGEEQLPVSQPTPTNNTWAYVAFAALILGVATLLYVQPRLSRGSSNTYD